MGVWVYGMGVWVYGYMGMCEGVGRGPAAYRYAIDMRGYEYGCLGVGCMGVWVCGCMGVWVYGCMGVWVYGCMGVWVYGCVGEGQRLIDTGVLRPLRIAEYRCGFMSVWMYGCWAYGCMGI